ncbi:MAG: hypothetical protein NZV14_09080 [Bryobacteraceae bacterium]|nr:hypothetical protein [Bryobacteraceae bacterium]MDW8378303.1 hypothetical protein [Bryobacterales bacterium]
MVKFFPLPDPRKGTVTKAMLADLKRANLIPPNIGVFASADHWIESVGVAPPLEGAAPKMWRDNATLWSARDTFQYLTLERGAKGELVRWPINFSDPMFQYLSPGAAAFYHEYAKHFPTIPRLVLRTLTRDEAARLHFGAGVAEDYPLANVLPDETGPIPGGLRATFPSDMALRFHPQTGQPEAFRYHDYVRAYPVDYTPYLPPLGAQRLSDEELVQAVESVLQAQLSLKEKASVIRQIASR